MRTDLTKLPRRNHARPTGGSKTPNHSATAPQSDPKAKATTAQASADLTKGRLGLKAATR